MNQGASFKLKRSRRSKLSESYNLNDQPSNKLNENKILNVHFNGKADIELNSFIVNKLDDRKKIDSRRIDNTDDENEIDEDDDYDEEVFFENDLEEDKKLDRNKVFSKSEDNKQTINKLIDSKVLSTNKVGKIIFKTNNVEELNSKFADLIPKFDNNNQEQLKAPTLAKFKSPNKLDLVYMHRSPNYCLANCGLKILGTSNRTCNRKSTVKQKSSGNCDLLCCGRGYDKRTIHRKERCQCSFDAVSTLVECEFCEFNFEKFTCK